MNKERLLKLADLLEADANNPTGVKFDLGTWAADADLPLNWVDGDPHLYAADQIIPVNCNTAACAVGLAAISGTFKDEGFGYEIYHGQLSPTYDGQDGFWAVRKFFDIDTKESNFLFSNDEYPRDKRKGRDGELAVAARIREFVENYNI